MTPPIPPVIGKRVGVQPIDEAEHFFRCEACRGWIDMRDLGAVLDHEGGRCRIRRVTNCGGVCATGPKGIAPAGRGT